MKFQPNFIKEIDTIIDLMFQSLIGIKWNFNQPDILYFFVAKSLFQSLIGIKWNFNGYDIEILEDEI